MHRALVLVLAPLLACADDQTGATGSDDESSSSGGDASSTGDANSSTGDSDASTSTGPEPTSTGDVPTTDPGFDPPVAMCGNGYVEGDEQCDDANDIDGDSCTADCKIPCGLERELVELAPTAESAIGGLRVVAGPDGGVVVVARVQEVILDQEQNEQTGPRQGLVVSYDAAGDKRWERRLGPDMGDLDLAGGAVDASGDVVVIGSVDADDKQDIWIAKLAGEDGAELWSVAVDGDFVGSDDLGTGVAITASGDIVASGQIRHVDKDDDVWVQKLDPDGAPIWTTTWSGTANNGFSNEDGGPVAVAPDGGVYVLAREYVDFETLEAVLLKFGDDGDPLWARAPLADGGAHSHEPGGLADDAEGQPLIVIQRFGDAPTFWLYKLDAQGEPLWDLARADFEVAGEDWMAEGVGVLPDGEVVVGGSWLDDESLADTEWYELWLARLDPGGAKRCQISYRAPGEDLVPPSLLAADFAAGAEGAALATAERFENGESSLWTALFRPL